MTPAQRIARLLHERGREVTPEAVTAWMRDYQNGRRSAGKAAPCDDTIAHALESGRALHLVALLHLKFGDDLTPQE